MRSEDSISYDNLSHATNNNGDVCIEMSTIGSSSMECLLEKPERRLSKPLSIISSVQKSGAKQFSAIFDKVKTFINNMKMLVFLLAYSVFGAWIFMRLEIPTDVANKEEAYNYHLVARDVLLFNLRTIHIEDTEDREYRWKEAIIHFEKEIGAEPPDIETAWTFWMAILYAGTIYTTIGYGNISCVTVSGRLATIGYAIIGIPLMLILLNDLSNFLLKVVRKISAVSLSIKIFISDCIGIKKVLEPVADKLPILSPTRITTNLGLMSAGSQSTLDILDEKNENDANEEQEEENDMGPPVIASITITIGWIFFASAIFCIFEDWTYFTSIYFFFISTSTIGFGDVSPAHPEYTMATFGVVMVGLALVSVCINVITDQLARLYMRLLQKMLKDYMNEMEAGNADAANKKMMSAFQGKGKFLMPLISKGQGAKVMEKFKKEAADKGLELPAVLLDINPETGMPAFATAKETNFKDFIEKAQENQVKQQAELAKKASTISPTGIVPERQEKTVANAGQQTSTELQQKNTQTIINIKLLLEWIRALQTAEDFIDQSAQTAEILKSKDIIEVEDTAQDIQIDLIQWANRRSQTQMTSFTLGEQQIQEMQRRREKQLRKKAAKRQRTAKVAGQQEQRPLSIHPADPTIHTTDETHVSQLPTLHATVETTEIPLLTSVQQNAIVENVTAVVTSEAYAEILEKTIAEIQSGSIVLEPLDLPQHPTDDEPKEALTSEKTGTAVGDTASSISALESTPATALTEEVKVEDPEKESERFWPTEESSFSSGSELSDLDDIAFTKHEAVQTTTTSFYRHVDAAKSADHQMPTQTGAGDEEHISVNYLTDSFNQTVVDAVNFAAQTIVSGFYAPRPSEKQNADTEEASLLAQDVVFQMDHQTQTRMSSFYATPNAPAVDQAVDLQIDDAAADHELPSITFQMDDSTQTKTSSFYADETTALITDSATPDEPVSSADIVTFQKDCTTQTKTSSFYAESSEVIAISDPTPGDINQVEECVTFQRNNATQTKTSSFYADEKLVEAIAADDTESGSGDGEQITFQRNSTTQTKTSSFYAEERPVDDVAVSEPASGDVEVITFQRNNTTQTKTSSFYADEKPVEAITADDTEIGSGDGEQITFQRNNATQTKTSSFYAEEKPVEDVAASVDAEQVTFQKNNTTQTKSSSFYVEKKTASSEMACGDGEYITFQQNSSTQTKTSGFYAERAKRKKAVVDVLPAIAEGEEEAELTPEDEAELTFQMDGCTQTKTSSFYAEEKPVEDVAISETASVDAEQVTFQKNNTTQTKSSSFYVEKKTASIEMACGDGEYITFQQNSSTQTKTSGFYAERAKQKKAVVDVLPAIAEGEEEAELTPEDEAELTFQMDGCTQTKTSSFYAERAAEVVVDSQGPVDLTIPHEETLFQMDRSAQTNTSSFYLTETSRAESADQVVTQEPETDVSMITFLKDDESQTVDLHGDTVNVDTQTVVLLQAVTVESVPITTSDKDCQLEIEIRDVSVQSNVTLLYGRSLDEESDPHPIMEPALDDDLIYMADKSTDSKQLQSYTRSQYYTDGFTQITMQTVSTGNQCIPDCSSASTQTQPSVKHRAVQVKRVRTVPTVLNSTQTELDTTVSMAQQTEQLEQTENSTWTDVVDVVEIGLQSQIAVSDSSVQSDPVPQPKPPVLKSKNLQTDAVVYRDRAMQHTTKPKKPIPKQVYDQNLQTEAPKVHDQPSETDVKYLNDRASQTININKWLKTHLEELDAHRRQRMLDIGIQTGVLSRVQHLYRREADGTQSPSASFLDMHRVNILRHESSEALSENRSPSSYADDESTSHSRQSLNEGSIDENKISSSHATDDRRNTLSPSDDEAPYTASSSHSRYWEH